ncbi:MAG: hypothetical protein ACE5EN_00420 [Nitrospinota bacterium]
MRLRLSIKTFIFALALSTVAISVSESAERIAPTPPPTSNILGKVGSDFIVANERKYIVTPKTVIKNHRGQKISLRQLKIKSKLLIEYKFVEKGKTNVPEAKLIKVLSEP